MGQKVNPHGLRVGIIKDWDSRWFADKKSFGDSLVEDYNLRVFLKKKLFPAGVDRIEIEKFANKIRISIHAGKPGIVIGKGGSVIQKIVAESGAKIDIDDDGTIHIASADAAACDAAKKCIDDIVFVPEVGKLYYGRVVRLMQFGAFVEIAPGKDGLVHISKLDKKRVEKVEDVVTVGDMIWVKFMEIDEKGRWNLSHKDAMKEIRAKEAAGEKIQ